MGLNYLRNLRPPSIVIRKTVVCYDLCGGFADHTGRFNWIEMPDRAHKKHGCRYARSIWRKFQPTGQKSTRHQAMVIFCQVVPFFQEVKFSKNLILLKMRLSEKNSG